MACAEVSGDTEDVGGAGPRAERAQIRRLDRRAVGHRIGERHPQLDHIRAALDQRVEDGGRGAIAGSDESDKRGAAREGVFEAGHLTQQGSDEGAEDCASQSQHACVDNTHSNRLLVECGFKLIFGHKIARPIGNFTGNGLGLFARKPGCFEALRR